MCLRKSSEQPSVVDDALIAIFSHENVFRSYICTIFGHFLLAFLFILRSRVKVEGTGQDHAHRHLHWLIKILTQPEAIWDSMWPLCRGHSERKRHSLAHTDITDHYSYPGLSLMPPCLESCVWSWTDPGPALKPSNVLAAHHMGPSQGETRRVFPLPICLV